MRTASLWRLARRSAVARRQLLSRIALHLLLVRAVAFPVPASAAPQEPPTGPLVAQLSADAKLAPDGRLIALRTSAAEPRSSGPRTVRLALAPDAAPRGGVVRILATAYSSTPDQTDSSPFITASGTRVHDGTVAINRVRFGTKVRFLNYRPDKIFTVEDRHNRRLSPRVDIWLPSRRAALEFGKRTLQMVIVERP